MKRRKLSMDQRGNSPNPKKDSFPMVWLKWGGKPDQGGAAGRPEETGENGKIVHDNDGANGCKGEQGSDEKPYAGKPEERTQYPVNWSSNSHGTSSFSTVRPFIRSGFVD